MDNYFGSTFLRDAAQEGLQFARLRTATAILTSVRDGDPSRRYGS